MRFAAMHRQRWARQRLHHALDEWHWAVRHSRHVDNTMLRAVQRMQGNTLRDLWDWFVDHVHLAMVVRKMRTMAYLRLKAAALDELALHAAEQRKARQVVRICRRRAEVVAVKWAFNNWRKLHLHERQVQNVLVRAVQRMQGNSLRYVWDWLRDRIRVLRIIQVRVPRPVGRWGWILHAPVHRLLPLVLARER